MFHLASAIFWAVAQPVSLVMLLLAGGTGASILQWHRLSLVLCSASLVLLFLSGWTTVGALLLQPLEERFQRPDPPPRDVDGIIVLGGGMESGINLARSGYELNSGGDRPVEAAVLARHYPEARIVVSGGSGSVFTEGEGDADSAPRLLTALGAEPERIELEKKSRDTYENALFSARQINPRPGQTWLLVTSAFHMPRSVGVFRSVGFPVVPWPVDYKTSGREGIGLSQDNLIDTLDNITVAVREWIGLIAYRVAGRTDELLPAPGEE
ncbi:YdcF family protein [Chelativorans sp. YIM 93263]|uniref:YdcF family protein n=1 Tax=Chelativorans sp. YIM 93263 TaxID=2906648 RepID=UPI002378BCD9|nr:YdcF family protein [Chelativorans sp. YIM 93263]